MRWRLREGVLITRRWRAHVRLAPPGGGGGAAARARASGGGTYTRRENRWWWLRVGGNGGWASANAGGEEKEGASASGAMAIKSALSGEGALARSRGPGPGATARALPARARRGRRYRARTRAAVTDAPDGAEAKPANVEPGMTPRDAFFTLFKANVGPGCLSLPFAFAQAGTLLGPVSFVSLAAYSLYSQHLILDCKEAANDRRTRRGDQGARTYGEVAGACLGPLGQTVTELSVVLVQLGICVVFFDFLAESFEAGAGVEAPHAYLVGGFMPFVMLLSLPRDIKALAPLSAAANAATLLALLAVFGATGEHALTEGAAIQTSEGLPRGLLTSFPVFLGSAVYAFEGQTLILPVETAIQNSADFRRILDTSFVTVASLLLAVGWLSYASLGDIADVPITAELQARGFDMHVVNLLLCGSVLLTFPLQLTPAMSIIEEKLLGIPAPPPPGERLGVRGWVKEQVQSVLGIDAEAQQAAEIKRRTAARVSAVALLAGCACVVPNIGLAAALVGSLPGSMVALILPPLMHLYAIDDNRLQRAGHVLMIGASTAFMFYGTSKNVMAVVSATSTPVSPMEELASSVGPADVPAALLDPEIADPILLSCDIDDVPPALLAPEDTFPVTLSGPDVAEQAGDATDQVTALAEAGATAAREHPASETIASAEGDHR